MKTIIITIILILFSLLPAHAVKKIEANPINVAVVLVEKGDSDNIDNLFKYYGYTLQGQEDGYNIMKHDKGDIIRYSFNYDGKINSFPNIIIKPKGSH